VAASYEIVADRHQLTTIEDGAPVSCQIIDERIADGDEGEPYLESIAERDYAETESLPDHQLEHALERDEEGGAAAPAPLARAEAVRECLGSEESGDPRSGRRAR